MVELPGLYALARIVDPVAERFATAGRRLYLVGGVVRDLVLAGDEPFDPKANDIDLTTDALPAEIKDLVAPLADAVWTQGERFGTIGVMVGGQPLEITTHRAEAYDPESRKPIVTFGRELDEDLSRRDFTVNAMAIELPARSLQDPYHGRGDLAAGRLRTPLSPEISFNDDPLRIMRAARFVARLGLEPAPELVVAAGRLSERLEIVSVERVADELERLLMVEDPSDGLAFLAETGALGHIIHPYGQNPDLADLGMRLASSPDGGLTVRRAGLLWPLRSVGPDRARASLSRLKYAKADQVATARLIDAVAYGLEPGLSRPDVRRLVASVGLDGVPAVMALTAMVENHDSEVAPGSAERLGELVDDLRRNEDLTDTAPVLDGTEVIELLGLEPGPDVGRALRFLTEYRLENGPLSPDEARELLRNWWPPAADGN